jgi:hypothetical protein
MARTFRKRGLRRDRNFSDIPNPNLALNNLLDGLIQTADDRFVSKDLDVMRGLSATTMTNRDLRRINNSALKGIDPADPLAVFRPIITLQNRFDEARFTIGDPQFFGGDGLTQRYYTPDNTNVSALTYDDVTIDPNVFIDDEGEEVTSRIFWENGQYTFISGLGTQLPTNYGCIEFNGYFRPDRSGSWQFNVNTTGLFTFEFNNHTSDIDFSVDSFSAKKVDPVMTIETQLADGQSDAVIPAGTQFGEDVIDQILEGDVVRSDTLAPFNDPDNPITVESINREDRTIEFSTTFSGTSQTVNLDFVHSFGESGSLSYNTSNLTEYGVYPIRIRYIWLEEFGDNNPEDGDENSITFFVSPPASSSRTLDYKYLYSEDYNNDPVPGSVESGDFYEFFSNRVPPGGTRLVLNDDGSVGTEVGFSGYRSVISKGNIVLDYEAPQNYDEVVYTKSLGYSDGSAILGVGNTDGIAVGNLVFGPNVPPDTLVIDIAINEAVFLNNALTGGSGSGTFYFIDQKGLKSYDPTVTFSSGSNTISGVDTNNVSVGDIAVCFGTESTSTWTRVTSVGTSSIDVSQNLTQDTPSSPANFVLFYFNNGLEDQSLDTYCAGTIGAITTGVASAGDTVIPITGTEDYSGSSTTVPVGYFAFYGDRIPDGTTVTASSASSITLSNPLSDDIQADQTIVFVETNDNKDLCFPPIDTSPPFAATLDGLRTTSARPTITVDNETGEIKFVRLFGENVTTGSANTSSSYDTEIPIKDVSGNTFRILASS